MDLVIGDLAEHEDPLLVEIEREAAKAAAASHGDGQQERPLELIGPDLGVDVFALVVELEQPVVFLGAFDVFVERFVLGVGIELAGQTGLLAVAEGGRKHGEEGAQSQRDEGSSHGATPEVRGPQGTRSLPRLTQGTRAAKGEWVHSGWPRP